jgi:hypothetical protein
MLLLFVLTTILFGSSLVLLIKQKFLVFFFHVTLGWLLGSMVTGLLIFIETYFIPLSKTLVYIAMVIQVILSAFIFAALWMYYKNERKQRFKISFNHNPWLLLSMLFAVVYSVIMNYQFFRPFPRFIPHTARPYLEAEHSAMASMFVGINRRRSRFFVLNDPMCAGQVLKMSPIPITYVASMAQLSPNFVDASFIISTLNAMSAAAALYTLASCYTTSPFVCVVFILLNGGWVFFRYLYTSNTEVDLIHDVDRGFNVPFYQIFYNFIISSKTASFAFPMAIYAVTFTIAHRTNAETLQFYLLSGILTALCPSFMTSASLFILSTCNMSSIFFIIPFVFTLIFKWKYANLKYEPIWREYQKNGIFFSQILTWVDAFGPVAIMLIAFIVFHSDLYVMHRAVITLTVVTFLSFFRNGGYYFDNALAAASVVYPIFSALFFRGKDVFVRKCKSKTSGVINALFHFIVLTSIAGGVLSGYRQVIRCVPGVSPQEHPVGSWIVKHVPMNETVFMIQMPMNPISFSSGRNVYSGMPQDIWERGENFRTSTNALRRIDLVGGAPKLMRILNLTYLLEYKEVPLVSKDESLHKQFIVLERNEKYKLMKLIKKKADGV